MSHDHSQSFNVITVGGRKYSKKNLLAMLPTIELTLFFGKLMKLKKKEVWELLHELHGYNDVIDALTNGSHSTELQPLVGSLQDKYDLKAGDTTFTDKPLPAEVLPDLWEASNIIIAEAIQEVADATHEVLSQADGLLGEMHFQTLMKFNRKTQRIGQFAPLIRRKQQGKALVIMDVSGSVSASTVKRIANDAVALAIKANAGFAVVSDNTFYWEPGTYTVQSILAASEYSGTNYLSMQELFQQDWAFVIGIADYDSYTEAKSVIANCRGNIGKYYDISLVNMPTYLGECIATRANEVELILVGNSDHVLS